LFALFRHTERRARESRLTQRAHLSMLIS
jgi:hypothetical protein